MQCDKCKNAEQSLTTTSGGDCVESGKDEYYMWKAILQAQKAVKYGDVPIGCVLVEDSSGKVVASAFNERERKCDATAHAEVQCIKKACKKVGDWRLSGCTLYVTLEPCPMCFGAILNARIGRVVFGAGDDKAGFLGGYCDFTGKNILNHSFSVTSGVFAEECCALLADFFKARRAENKAKKQSEKLEAENKQD